ncbi:CPBP family glutamic-type intramembrane protease [Alteraurantiacibacter aquimixticola]|nr:CPBP family glutamic-type intramembrane protease [Alteraurantiacibacter aquimixticola]
MAISEARLAILARHGRGLLADVWAFAKNPSPVAEPLAPGRTWAALLLLLLALDMAVALGAQTVLWGAEFAGYEPPEPYESDLSVWEDLLQLVILAPILEEAIFRGWLSGKGSALKLGLRCIVGVAIMLLGDVVLVGRVDETMAFAVWLAGLIILFASLVLWLLNRKRESSVPDWFSRNYRLLVWGSALAFGLSHLVNYEGQIEVIDAILVLSQTVGGLILAYTRTRLGLAAAIAQHAMFNALVFAFE